MADNDNIVGWFTVNGQHIPIKEGQSKEEAFKSRQMEWSKSEGASRNSEDKQDSRLVSQKFHKEQIAELDKPKYEDGTYDVVTKQIKEFPDGYQVTFCQIGDNYRDEEYSALCSRFLRASTDGRTWAGKYGGTPEISFHVASMAQAKALAKEFNQESIYEWKTGNCIDTGGTGRRK